MQSVVALRTKGFSAIEISAICLGQIRRIGNDMEVVGIAVPDDHAVAFRAQVISRTSTGARATDPFISAKKERGNRATLEWCPRPVEPAQRKADPWLSFSASERLASTNFVAAREINRTHHRRGADPKTMDISSETLQYMLSVGLIETTGTSSG